MGEMSRPGRQTAHYQIAVVNRDAAKTSTHTGYDIFRGKRDSAWGWSKLINLSKLHDASQARPCRRRFCCFCCCFCCCCRRRRRLAGGSPPASSHSDGRGDR